MKSSASEPGLGISGIYSSCTLNPSEDLCSLLLLSNIGLDLLSCKKMYQFLPWDNVNLRARLPIVLPYMKSGPTATNALTQLCRRVLFLMTPRKGSILFGPV